MSKKYKGLGKGLNELLAATMKKQEGTPVYSTKASTKPSTTAAVVETKIQEPPLEIPGAVLKYLSVNELAGGPFQPRQHIRHEGLEEFAESIKSKGVLQPIVARQKSEHHYEIIAGERRWRASKLAGLDKVPVLVKEVSDEDAFALALIENIQREDLNPIEEARALKRLADNLSLTHLEVAEAVGKSRASVTNALRLLSLNPEVQQMLEEGLIDMGHARALLSISGSMQTQIAKTIVARSLSVRETEKLVKRIQDGKSAEKQEVDVDPNIRRLENDLSDKLGAKVAIRHGQKGGMVVIRYHNVDELEGILEHIQ